MPLPCMGRRAWTIEERRGMTFCPSIYYLLAYILLCPSCTSRLTAVAGLTPPTPLRIQPRRVVLYPVGRAKTLDPEDRKGYLIARQKSGVHGAQSSAGHHYIDRGQILHQHRGNERRRATTSSLKPEGWDHGRVKPRELAHAVRILLELVLCCTSRWLD